MINDKTYSILKNPDGTFNMFRANGFLKCAFKLFMEICMFKGQNATLKMHIMKVA